MSNLHTSISGTKVPRVLPITLLMHFFEFSFPSLGGETSTRSNYRQGPFLHEGWCFYPVLDIPRPRIRHFTTIQTHKVTEHPYNFERTGLVGTELNEVSFLHRRPYFVVKTTTRNDRQDRYRLNSFRSMRLP